MRRVVGAGLILIVLGGGHVASFLEGRREPVRPAQEARAVQPAQARPAGPAGGLPPSYAIDPMRFFSVAPAESLELLPGIGPVLASRIVIHRNARGPFNTWTELDRVQGIGPATIRRLQQAARRP